MQEKTRDRIEWFTVQLIVAAATWAVARYWGNDYALGLLALLVVANGWNGRSAREHTELAKAVDIAVAKVIAARSQTQEG